MEFKAFESSTHGRWLVEAIDTESEGEMLWASFYGSQGQERAKEYAEWMNSRHAARQSRHRYNRKVPLGNHTRHAKRR